MASTCIHGFATGTCLICRTLDGPPATPPAARPPTTSRRAATRAGRAGPAAGQDHTAVEPTSPRVLPSDGHGPRSALGLQVIGLAIVAVVVVALAWTFLHLVFAVLHILELIAVAVVAGYLAWKAGVHHGRRTGPPRAP